MIITVLAGLKLAHYQKYLGSQTPLLRVMPNIASAAGEGMSLFTYGSTPSSEFRSLSHILFSCMGEVMELSEPLMDVGCAVAGSGPGFVLRLIDAMAKEGEKQGLSRAQALKMAAQTFAGAARLILKGDDPATLLQQIATPNGVTEAGLQTMTSLHIDSHLQKVVEVAAQRSRSLSQELS
jgi:pyrroline-5-carboxylate reductase